MDDRRPLPLVTADGPVCQESCPCFSFGNIRTVYDMLLVREVEYAQSICSEDGGPTRLLHSCLPALREAWLREQRRKLEVCGRCVHSKTGRCPDVYRVLDNYESCSRFEERKDG